MSIQKKIYRWFSSTLYIIYTVHCCRAQFCIASLFHTNYTTSQICFASSNSQYLMVRCTLCIAQLAQCAQCAHCTLHSVQIRRYRVQRCPATGLHTGREKQHLIKMKPPKTLRVLLVCNNIILSFLLAYSRFLFAYHGFFISILWKPESSSWPEESIWQSGTNVFITR